MAKEVHVTYEKKEETVSIQFRLQDPIPCSLIFSSRGRMVLEIPDNYSDVVTQFGLHLLFADELKMDIAQLEVILSTAVNPSAEAASNQHVVNAVRRLCLCANLYFKDRAAFYWGILSSQCSVANMYVLSHRYKIAYKQLIEIDSVLINNM